MHKKFQNYFANIKSNIWGILMIKKRVLCLCVCVYGIIVSTKIFYNLIFRFLTFCKANFDSFSAFNRFYLGIIAF